MDGRLIFIDDQSSGVPTTALLQSLQTDDSSIPSDNLPLIVKSVIANPDIFAMISGGIKRMKGLLITFMFRLSSYCSIFSLTMAFSRSSNSRQDLQGELFEEHETLLLTPCGSSTVT